jgi:FAD:protein FMN transferase
MSSRSLPRTRPEGRALEALGTRCEVLVDGGDVALLDRVVGWIRAMHARLTRFAGGSELSRLNRSGGRWVDVSPELASLLGAALWAYDASGGLVHAGVLGPVVAAGYARPLREGPLPPDTSALEPPPPLPEMLAVRGQRARVAPAHGVDLGGLAKGWMADRLAASLGCRCLINLGGDLRCTGTGWPIDFAGTPVLLPRSGAAATSSTRHRRWPAAGAVMHHLIDPRTGRPADTGLSEVSVIAATALEAEVLAKTALLLGPVAAPPMLTRAAAAWRLLP